MHTSSTKTIDQTADAVRKIYKEDRSIQSATQKAIHDARGKFVMYERILLAINEKYE